MPVHSTLTGADLHESKGADTAAANTVAIANGSGGTVWTNVAAANVPIVDAAGYYASGSTEGALAEAYQISYTVEGVFADVSNVETLLLPIPYSCTVLSIKMILANAITLANSIVAVTRSDGASMGSQTIAFTGSAEGTVFNFTPSGNNTFTGGTHNYIKLVSDGGSTTTSKLYVSALIRRS